MYHITVTALDGQSTFSWYAREVPTIEAVYKHLIESRIRSRFSGVEAVHVANGARYRLDPLSGRMAVYEPNFTNFRWND